MSVELKWAEPLYIIVNMFSDLKWLFQMYQIILCGAQQIIDLILIRIT